MQDVSDTQSSYERTHALSQPVSSVVRPFVRQSLSQKYTLTLTRTDLRTDERKKNVTSSSRDDKSRFFSVNKHFEISSERLGHRRHIRKASAFRIQNRHRRSSMGKFDQVQLRSLCNWETINSPIQTATPRCSLSSCTYRLRVKADEVCKFRSEPTSEERLILAKRTVVVVGGGGVIFKRFSGQREKEWITPSVPGLLFRNNLNQTNFITWLRPASGLVIGQRCVGAICPTCFSPRFSFTNLLFCCCCC